MHKVDAKEIIARLKALLHVKTDKELAEKIEVPIGTILSWKGRGSIPADSVLEICYVEDLRPAYVLFGEGEPEFVHRDEPFDKNVIAVAINIGFQRLARRRETGAPCPDEVAREYIWAAIVNDYSEVANRLRFLRDSGLYESEEEVFAKLLDDYRSPPFQWWRFLSK